MATQPRLPTIAPNATKQRFSSTQISRRVEVEAQALLHGSPIRTAPIEIAGREVGTVFLYQRRLAGLGTGIGDGVVLLHAGSETISHASIADRLMRATPFDLTTFRVVGAKPNGLTTGRSTRSDGRMAAITVTNDVQEALPIGRTYTEFLGTLGRGTRRNIEHARKRAEQAGVTFEWLSGGSAATRVELNELCRNNMPTPRPTRPLASVQSLIAGHTRQFFATLRGADGRLISAAGGFVQDDLALMLYQFNHRDYRVFNPSLTLRSFIVQRLTSDNIRHLAFVGSCSGLLRHACERIPATEILITRKSFLASVKLALCRFVEPKSRIALLATSEPVTRDLDDTMELVGTSV